MAMGKGGGRGETARRQGDWYEEICRDAGWRPYGGGDKHRQAGQVGRDGERSSTMVMLLRMRVEPMANVKRSEMPT